MRLLNTETLQLALFEKGPFPEYAILSHRWGNEEISFRELEAGLGADKSGYQKIRRFCAKARNRGFKWCWVDTCGIDKTSSAELSEAINSMYKWYKNSSVCFAYMPDVTAQIQPDGSFHFQDFNCSCWFTRGWTLQELIAPLSVEFYTSEWIYIGDKRSMAEELSVITAVDKGVLLGTSPVRASSVATIMSWASHRVTTRREDIAYCLLGLFSIHMPLLYGEGDRAFIRLQEEILKQSSDQSLFAWNPLLGGTLQNTASEGDSFCGILSSSPACFAEASDIIPLPGYWDTESALTNRGIRLRMPLKYDTLSKSFIGILCCATRSPVQDIAIEFHCASNSLEDLDHLIRRSSPVRFGDWSDDPQVHFSTVYLATETSLWHIRHFGPRFMKTEYEFHLLLQDPDNLANLDGTPELYPPGALIEEPSVILKETEMVKRIAVLNPLNSLDNTIAIVLPTKLSQNIALKFGFKTLQSGLPDVQHPWKTIVPISKDCLLEDVWSGVMERQPIEDEDISGVTIDEVYIRVEIVQQSWWARTSKNILISFSRVVHEEMAKVQAEIKQGIYFAEEDAQRIQILPSLVPVMSYTGAGKTHLISDLIDTEVIRPVATKRILGPLTHSMNSEMEEVD
jgi:hypothetical protein